MTTYVWKQVVNGDWGTAVDWEEDAVPNSSSADAFIPSAAGTVTISGSEAFAVYSLSMLGGSLQTFGGLTITGTLSDATGLITIAAGKTLTVSGAASFGGDSVLDGPGTLATGGGTTIVASPGTAAYYYRIAWELGGGAVWSNGGTASDAGVILVGDATGTTAAFINQAGAAFDLTLDGDGIYNSFPGNGAGANGTGSSGSATFLNAGTLAKTAGTGSSIIQAAMTDTGTITVASGTLEFDGGGSFSGGIGGSGTVAFNGGSSTLSATGSFTADSLLMNGGTLIDAGNVSAGNTVSISGNALQLTGGTFSAAGLAITPSALVSGFGLITAPVNNSGTIEAENGLLQIASSLTGTGALQIETGATLEISGASTERVSFAGADATLKLDAPSSYTGTIEALAPTDTIDLAGLIATDPLLHGSTLTVDLQSGGTLSYAVSGIAGAPTLRAQGDGETGTDIIIAGSTVATLAEPIFPTTTLNFGAARVGSLALTQALPIENGTTTNPLQQSLLYSIAAPLAPFGVSSGETGTIVAGFTATPTLALSTATSGNFNGTSATVDLTSIGSGASGSANTTLTSQTVTFNGEIFASAVPKLNATSVNFGVVHMGTPVSQALTVANIATGALVDSLVGGFGTVTGVFTGSGTLDVVASATGTLTIGLSTTTSGVETGSAALALDTHDTALANIAVSAGPINLTGTVDNYATAALKELSGGGSFSQTGSLYRLNLGTIELDATAPTIDLEALNAASGLADLLSGSFEVTGSGFINSGLVAFSGLGAGQADNAPTVSLLTSNVGTFTESITLLGTGSNGGGYLETLTPEVLTVTGTVTILPRTLVWVGATSTDFGTASNWDDTTLGLDPATGVPGATDTVEFDSNGDVITGTGSVAALSFGGGGAWHLASGAALTTSGSAVVGSSQSGVLLIDEGSDLTNGSAIITSTASASGSSVNVTGSGSNWQIGGSLDVGNAAAASLDIADGGSVRATSLDAGIAANSAGIVTVVGTGASLTTTGTVSIGDAGAGELAILDGANASIDGDLNIANTGTGPGTGSGNVDIEDTTGTIFLGGNINVGFNGVGVLTIGPDVTYIQDNGGVNAGPDSTVTLDSLSDPSPYLNNTSPNPFGINVSGVDPYQAYVYNIGDIVIGAGHSLTIETPLISGAGGKFTLNTGTDLTLDADTVSGQTFDLTGDNTLEIGSDQLATIKQPASGTGPFTAGANPNQGQPTIDGFDSTIAGFAAGDTIIVDTPAGTATFSQNGTTVAVIENGATLGVLTFDTAAAAKAAANPASDALIDHAVCFLAGTLIRTPSGEGPVERLSAGDLILTASGQSRPVVWIGEGRVLATRGRRNAATPVIVRKGAPAPNVPHADLRVTKGHSFFVDGVLIPVEFLVNHRSILWDDRAQEVSIYHIELETHDVLLANGAPAESYRDDGNRWLFRNANTGWGLAPQVPCAPVLTGGPVVDAIWRRLLGRSGPRKALPLTDDPDLYLLVDGKRIDAIERHDEMQVFRLPVRPRSVRICSRAAVPQELGIARDNRPLGVAVRRIVLAQPRQQFALGADSALLTDGYHAFEPDNGIRWTDGDAAISAELFADLDGPSMLILHLGGTTHYLDGGTVVRAA